MYKKIKEKKFFFFEKIQKSKEKIQKSKEKKPLCNRVAFCVLFK
jgi:hypothetical protein